MIDKKAHDTNSNVISCALLCQNALNRQTGFALESGFDLHQKDIDTT